MEQHFIEETSLFVSPEERAYLVRLCAAITGDRAVAEDLAQETLLEAWRHKLLCAIKPNARPGSRLLLATSVSAGAGNIGAMPPISSNRM